MRVPNGAQVSPSVSVVAPAVAPFSRREQPHADQLARALDQHIAALQASLDASIGAMEARAL